MAAPLIQGASADVGRLRAELAQRSRGDPASAAALWREAQAAALAHSARLLAAALEQPVPAADDQARPPTAGVSYVVHTESWQMGSDGLPHLPHLGEPPACC